MNRILLPLFACAVLAAACSRSDERPAGTRDTLRTQPDTGATAGDAPPTPVTPMVRQEGMAPAQAIEPLPTQKLRSVLPETIGGVKGLETSGGSLSRDGARWTTASRDYVASDGTFTVSVTDYADIQTLVSPFDNDYNVRPSAAEGEVSRFETPNGRGVIVWHTERREGWLAFSVQGRFDIRVRTSGLPSKIAGLRTVFDALPVSTLAREQ